MRSFITNCADNAAICKQFKSWHHCDMNISVRDSRDLYTNHSKPADLYTNHREACLCAGFRLYTAPLPELFRWENVDKMQSFCWLQFIFINISISFYHLELNINKSEISCNPRTTDDAYKLIILNILFPQKRFKKTLQVSRRSSQGWEGVKKTVDRKVGSLYLHYGIPRD